MENKHNFTGIIIPVIVAVILLTVLPIVNSINVECPPCEECPSYDIGQLNINPDFSSGNYIVDKNDYDYLDNVTIIKDNNLIPENIKKDVNIYGIVGTLEGDGGGIPNNEAVLLVESINNEEWYQNILFPIIVSIYDEMVDGDKEVKLYGATNSSGANETLLATFVSQSKGYNIYMYLLERSIYTHLKFTADWYDSSYLFYVDNSSNATKVNKNTYFNLTTSISSITIRAIYT